MFPVTMLQSRFKAHLLEVDLKEGLVRLLLREVRRLAGLKEAPESVKSCNDCSKVDKIVHILGQKR